MRAAGQGRAGGGGGGMAVYGETVSLPRPSNYTNLTHPDPLIKSTSEEDFSNRNSTASTASPAYYSDRSNPAMSPTESSSPFTMSPWNNQYASPWSNSSDLFSDPTATILFPPGTGLVVSLVREEGHIYSLAACRDLLYTGSDSKNIRVWKNQKEFSGFKASSGLVKAIVISAADHRIFTGHQDGKIRIWNLSPKNPASHKRVGTLPRLKDILRSSFNPTNFATARRRRSAAVSIRHSDAVSCLSLSDDQSLLYSGSWDRTIKVWRVADSRCLDSIAAHDDAVNSVVAAAFDGLVFSGSADGTVKVWRRETTGKATRHAAVQTLLKQECAVTSLVVNRLSPVVYCGSSDGVVNCWDFRDRQLSHGGVLRGHEMAVLCLAAAGSLLFTGGADKTICVWRRDGSGAHACLSVMTGHTGPVKCLAVEADVADSAGRMWVLYSGSLDKSVKVWKVADPAAAAADTGVQGQEQQQRGAEATSSYERPPRFDMY